VASIPRIGFDSTVGHVDKLQIPSRDQLQHTSIGFPDKKIVILKDCHLGIGIGGLGAVEGLVRLSGDALEKAIHPTAQTTSAMRKVTIHRNGRLDLRRLVS
jgi:hypothetical protein